MIQRALLAFTAGVALLAGTAAAQTRNPLGETADYEIDRSSSRTSSLITGGDMEAAVVEALPADPDGPAYRVRLDWTLHLRAGARQSGNRTFKVPELYFTPEFLQQLRENGEYVGPTFKARHMGYADAHNMDGGFYPNCDKVLIYDIENEELAGPVWASGDIEDMEILAHVQYGIPVLGAVKMDMTGRFQGQRVKAGADYEAP